MKSFLIKTILILATITFTVSADEVVPEGSLTTVLNDDNFDEFVNFETSEKPWFVLLYAPWCGHCKKVKPVWFELGYDLEDKADVGMVDW